MLVWFVLKLKDTFKYKYNDDRRISYINKKQYFWWGSEHSAYYIIPTISIYTGKYLTIEICWLQAYYCVSWNAISYEEEEAIAGGLRNLNKDKENESSSL